MSNADGHIRKMTMHYSRMKRAARYPTLWRHVVVAYNSQWLDWHREKFVKGVADMAAAKTYRTGEGEQHGG